MPRLLKPKTGETQREWLARQNPPLAIAGARGRFGKPAQAALAQAEANGWTFDAPAKPVKASAKPVVKAVAAKTAAAPTSDAHAVREWAGANGFTVGDRGRLPSAVLAAYNSREGK